MTTNEEQTVIEIGLLLGKAYALIENNENKELLPLKVILTAVVKGFEVGSEEDVELLFLKMQEFCTHMAKKRSLY